jgi:hypothetical protein
VNGLAVSNKRNENAPLWDPFTELQKMLRFRLVHFCVVHLRDALCVVCTLSFVKYDQVLGRGRRAAAVVSDVFLDSLNKRLPTTTCLTECML